MIKSFKIRLYPTRQQEQQMWQHIGACRYLWNWMLAYQEGLYEAGEKHLSAFSMIKLITGLKRDGEHEWLRNVSNASLQTVCGDLEGAYRAFFKKLRGFPKFKSRKRSKPNYPLRTDCLYLKSGHAVIAKLGKVKYKTDFVFPEGKGNKFTNPRISFVNGKWMLSFGMECENQVHNLNEQSMGIDLGVKDLAIVAFGDKKFVYHNINKSARMRNIQKRIKHTQRSISRKYERGKTSDGKFHKTNNISREEDKLRKLFARAMNIRTNHIHQTTHELVSLSPCRVVMEDLNVLGMMKNRHLSRAIQEQGFGEFIRQIKYKCEWNGIEFIQADRFFPSSKLCSSCGCIKAGLKLSERTYVCPECGVVIDRDYNAAINLMRYVA